MSMQRGDQDLHRIDRLRAPRVALVTRRTWLAKLQDPACRIDGCRAILGRVPADWRTQVRTDPAYRFQDYLFCAPTAVIEARLPGRVLQVPPGTLLWNPSGAHYDLALLGADRPQHLFRLRFRLWEGARLLTPFAEATPCLRAGSVPDLVRRLGVEFADGSVDAWYRARCLLGLLASDLLAEPQRHAGGRLSAQQLQQLTLHVAERPDQRPSPGELARVLGLSPVVFTRAFRRTVGCPPRAWLVERRIRLAADWLLESRRSIAEVGADLGYGNPFLFTRQFTAVMGMGPRAYRRRHAPARAAGDGAGPS